MTRNCFQSLTVSIEHIPYPLPVRKFGRHTRGYRDAKYF